MIGQTISHFKITDKLGEIGRQDPFAGPFTEDQFLSAPVVITTHDRWKLEATTGRDLGVRRCSGHRRELVVVDEDTLREANALALDTTAIAASHTVLDSAQRPSPMSAPPSEPSTLARSRVGGSAGTRRTASSCDTSAAGPSPMLHWK